MEQLKIDQILADYIRANLSPRKPERDMISRRYEQLSGFLSGQLFQTGSYARHTATRRVHDLDTFYVLPESVRRLMVERKIAPEELTLENIINDLAEALSKEYGNEARVVTQPHSVGIFFGSDHEFSIDVVPAQPAGAGLFLIPETALRSIRNRRALYDSKMVPKLRWIKSDPKGYIAQATELDESTKGIFRKAAKLEKKWREGCKKNNENFPLKSFHVEIMVTELMKSQKGLSLVGALEKFLPLLPPAVVSPQYRDRADSSRFIDSYVEDFLEEQKQMVLREHQRMTDLVSRILQAASEAQVLHALEDLLRMGTDGIGPVSVVVGATKRESPAYSKPYLR